MNLEEKTRNVELNVRESEDVPFGQTSLAGSVLDENETDHDRTKSLSRRREAQSLKLLVKTTQNHLINRATIWKRNLGQKIFHNIKCRRKRKTLADVTSNLT